MARLNILSSIQGQQYTHLLDITTLNINYTIPKLIGQEDKCNPQLSLQWHVHCKDNCGLHYNHNSITFNGQVGNFRPLSERLE